MAVGDVTIEMARVAAGASFQVQVTTRCKFRFGMGASMNYGSAAISSDGKSFYTVAAFGWVAAGSSNDTSIGDNFLYLPAGYYAKITNYDTNTHDVAAFAIEY